MTPRWPEDRLRVLAYHINLGRSANYTAAAMHTTRGAVISAARRFGWRFGTAIDPATLEWPIVVPREKMPRALRQPGLTGYVKFPMNIDADTVVEASAMADKAGISLTEMFRDLIEWGLIEARENLP